MGVPAGLKISIELPFVRDCEECRAAALSVAVAAIPDDSVTSIRLTPGKVHAHSLEQDGTRTRSFPQQGEGLFPMEPETQVNGIDPPAK